MADPTLLNQISEANKGFLAGHPLSLDSAGDPFVVVACIDSRLTGLIEPALGLPRNRASVIRTAGNQLSEKNVDALRSIAVALYVKQAREIVVLGHTDCALAGFSVQEVTDNFRKAGIPRSAFGNDDLRTWFGAFSSIRDNVTGSIAYLRKSGLVPADLKLHGLILDTNSGAIDIVVNGYLAPEPGVAVAAATVSTVATAPAAAESAPEPASPPQQTAPPKIPAPSQQKNAKGPIVIGEPIEKAAQVPPPDSLVDAVMIVRNFFIRERQSQRMQNVVAKLRRIWKTERSPSSMLEQLRLVAQAYESQYPELPGALAYIENAVRSGGADRIGFGEIIKRILE